MDDALKSNNISLINFIYSKFTENQFRFGIDSYINIIREGKVKAFDWLYEKGLIPTNQILDFCAEYGRIDLSEWCYQKGLIPDLDTYGVAICSGETNIVKWIYSKNIPLNNELFNSAICCGNVEMLEFMYEHGCRSNENTRKNFDEYPDTDNIKWIYSK